MNKIRALFMIVSRVLYKTFLFKALIPIFSLSAKTGWGTDKCLKKGFLPVPVHFYSPIPDIKELKARKIWDTKSVLNGIDFQVGKQVKMLGLLGKKFGKECTWPIDATDNPADFFINNNCFGFGCAAILYSLIREFKPKNIIEIGSGNSSKIINQAIIANALKIDYTIIDPYPADYITSKKIKYKKLIKKGVQYVKDEVFSSLKSGDILFIDSSHSVKIGSDVNRLFLDILPKLNRGVIIHVHDITLPYEYPKAYATNETFRQFWTEQYLLQAFLINNCEFEVLLANCLLMTDYAAKFRKAFPYYDPSIHTAVSGGFWMRKK